MTRIHEQMYLEFNQQKNENKNKKWNDFSIVRRENERKKNIFSSFVWLCRKWKTREKMCINWNKIL